MRKILIPLLLLAAACAPAEKEVLTTSVDVDETKVAALFAAIDELTGNALDVASLERLAADTPMDDERQERYLVTYNDDDEEILVHVWREQADWVHVYFSSTSKALIGAIEAVSADYARGSGDGVVAPVSGADPDPARFAAEIEAFAAWDGKNAVPADGVLFVGSSSMRLWATADAFPGKPVINRGFGGSELSDVLHFYDRIVLPYAPATIFVYAGDNDIENGKSADQVYDDWLQLVERVQADLPDTRLFFLSIKPSTARWGKWPEMQAANRLVREHAAAHERLGYVDLATPLLGADGRPKDVYLGDGLHLDADGYALWREALAPYLQ